MNSFIHMLREKCSVRRMEIECDPRNVGSRALAGRLGFELVREIEGAWECKGEWVGSCEFCREWVGPREGDEAEKEGGEKGGMSGSGER